MKISPVTIQALVTVITGDGGISPRRSGPQLIDFFRKYGCKTEYGSGFPSRKDFTKEELIKAYESRQIEQVIQDALDPRYYFETEFDPQLAADYLSKYLIYEEIEIVKEGLDFCVRALKTAGPPRWKLPMQER